MRFAAVAFDLDGTLYPDFRLYIRLVPFLLRRQRLLRAMDRARTQLRRTGAYGGDFYELQARLMGEILNETPEKVRERTDLLIYRGWEPHFLKIKLFPHARETLAGIRAAGLKMGLLSDFPPETKLKNLGISDCWDAVLCSERAGALKPALRPFQELALALHCPPEQILYVGNSRRYDVGGAKRAGMKTALFTGHFSRNRLFSGTTKADFTFQSYRQLRDFVL